MQWNSNLISPKSSYIRRFIHRFIAPSKRASIVTLCWLIWFVYHVKIKSTSPTIIDGQYIHQKSRHIKARIVHNLPVHGLHADGSDVEYRCSVGELIHKPKAYKLWGGLNGTRQPLQYPLNQSGVFDFAVHISNMKLKVLIVGNSLGEQLHAGLEEAMCYPTKITNQTTGIDRKLLAKQASAHCNTQIIENTNAQWVKEPRIVTTKSGGGMLAVIKDNTNMIETKTKWNMNNTAISSIVQALGNIDTSLDDNGITVNNINERGQRLLDVLVYQFQSGHIYLYDFDEYYLEEAISAASTLFQATTVIFPTIAWMNNVNHTNVDKLHEVNERIRNFARMYIQSSSSSVESVLVLDIAQLSTAYIEANAKILNIPDHQVYTLRLDSMFKPLVAHICASLPFKDNPRGCLPGMVSVSRYYIWPIYMLCCLYLINPFHFLYQYQNDGMHLCPETFHGRINAALVCLLDCKYNNILDNKSLTTCSNSCNSKYMSLDPITYHMSKDSIEEVRLT